MTGPVPDGLHARPPTAAPRQSTTFRTSATISSNPGNAFGNLGRNVVIGPGFSNVDFALVKNTKITERLTLADSRRRLRSAEPHQLHQPTLNGAYRWRRTRLRRDHERHPLPGRRQRILAADPARDEADLLENTHDRPRVSFYSRSFAFIRGLIAFPPATAQPVRKRRRAIPETETGILPPAAGPALRACS